MANTARDLIKCRISNDPGTTGDFELDTAFTNSLLPAAGDDGLAFKLYIVENGVGAEIRRNCTYTHSTTTFGRGTMVRSTGAADAALNFTSAAIVSVVPSAEDYLTTEEVAAIRAGGVYIQPTNNSTTDPAVAQAAADIAAAAGQTLYLGAGTWNFTTSGITSEGGLDVVRGGVAGVAYKALQIAGAGIGKTIINVGASQKAFWYSTPGTTGSFPRIADLSIIGPGVASGAIGIQIGGKSSVRSDLITEIEIERVLIDNVTSGMIFDDATGIRLRTVRVLRAKYHIEIGYNVDGLVMDPDCFWSPDDGYLSRQECVITSSSNSITGLPTAATARLQVGYAVLAPGLFPPGSYVGSIASTSVTVVDYNNSAVNATGNGTEVSFAIGRVISYGTTTAATAGTHYPSEGSPFVSPYWSTQWAAGTQGRVGAANHEIRGGFSQVEMVSDIPGSGTSNIWHSLYVESVGFYSRIGQSDQAIGPQCIAYERCYFGALDTIICAPIRVFYAQPEFRLSVKQCSTDSISLPYPWIEGTTSNYGAYGLSWEDSLLNTTLGYTLSIGNTVYSCRPLIATSFYADARRGDGIESRNGGAWEYHGQDGLKVDLTSADLTIQNPATFNTRMNGKLFTVYSNGITGRTLTFGTYFIDSDGTALGAVASGATGTKMATTFMWDDAAVKFRALSPVYWLA
jgi:hypothetical protein